MRPSDVRLGTIFVTVLMTQLSIGALNDWADRRADGLAHRAKPLVIGHASPKLALGLAIVFALCALPGALMFGTTAAVVLAVGLAAGFAYDLVLKPTPLSVVPFAVAFPMLPSWVAVIAGFRLSQLSSLMIAGAFLAAAIHLGDSLPDLEMDARSGIRSLGVLLGRSGSIRAMILCTLVGGAIAVAAVWSRPLVAGVVGVASLAAVVLIAVVVRANPAHARWIAGAFAMVGCLGLLSVLTHG